MASKYFYFDLDLHGVGFYEEEITIGSEQGTMPVDDVPLGEGAEDLLYDLFPQILIDHKHTTTYKITMPLINRLEPCEVQMEKPENLAANVPQPSHLSRRKHYKLTRGQLRELERVFRKNPYPDALKIHELAEILHVNECIVKVWFNSRRNKCRKDQRVKMSRGAQSCFQQQHSLKTSEKPNSGIVLHEPVVEGYIRCSQHPNGPCWP